MPRPAAVYEGVKLSTSLGRPERLMVVRRFSLARMLIQAPAVLTRPRGRVLDPEDLPFLAVSTLRHVHVPRQKCRARDQSQLKMFVPNAPLAQGSCHSLASVHTPGMPL